MITPILLILAILCALIPLAWHQGLTIGAERQRARDVDYIGHRGVSTYRSSWVASAIDLERSKL